MATNDLSRAAYYPQKRFSGVRLQQGRVLTDDDFNEQEHINHEDKRLTRKDVIGTAGSPDAGFAVSNAVDSDGVDFTINAGTFYLGGLRVGLADDQTFKLQPDWLQKPAVAAPAGERYDLAYLEVWQQSVSAVEDEELYEKALGGPDTTTRRRTMFRVKLAEGVGSDNCPLAWSQAVAKIESDVGGKMANHYKLLSDAGLTVGYEQNDGGEDLCSPSVLAGYLGAENQAIRVQLTDKDHFTWGFDNGAPLYRVTLEDAASDRKTIRLVTEPKDQAHWPLAGQIVEILPWSAVLENGEKLAEELSPGHFSRINDSYDPDSGKITLTTALAASFGEQWQNRTDANDLRTTRFGSETLANEYFFLRVWNRGAGDSSNSTIAFANTAVKLGTTGLNITIDGTHRLPGDHWVIAARPHTPDQVVPWQLETGRAPEGYQRFYAPLAIIHWNATGAAEPIIYDCRKTFRPLTDLEGCCTFTVGDGEHSNGDFNSIADAVKHLPSKGGRICVLPGVHSANVKVDERRDIHFTGCGDQSIVHPRQEQAEQPIFSFASCRNIKLDHLTLITHTGTAVEVADGPNASKASVDITIENNRILALIHAVDMRAENRLPGKNAVYIGHNNIGMWDQEQGEAAIFTDADDVRVEDNQIVVVPAPNKGDPNDPRDPDGPDGIIYDPCEDKAKYYGHHYFMYQVTGATLHYMQRAWAYIKVEYKAQGGIQVAGGSEQVRIVNNRITGGWGNGITLGDLPTEGNIGGYFKNKRFIDELDAQQMGHLDEKFNAYLYDIAIENNRIQNMGLSGIGVAAFFNLRKIGKLVAIEDVTIRENKIADCARQVPQEKPGAMKQEIGFGGIVLAGCENVIIDGNRIEDNGLSQVEPVCGILILYGEKIEISNNRILNNGPRTFSGDVDAQSGLRGGVVIRMTFKQLAYRIFQDKELLSPDGIPAVKVHDNIITQPLGQALFIMAFGPVSVIGNQLTSQGADFRVNPFSLGAGSVFILNLGVSKDLMGFLFLAGFKYLASANLAFSGAGLMSGRTTGMAAGGLVSADLSGIFHKILYLPNGNVLFANNQTTLDLRAVQPSFVFSSQLIASLDDIAYTGNQSECTSFVDYLYTDAALVGVSIRANDNRFQEGFTIALNSLFSFGFMNTAASNQATHCLQVYGAKTVYDPADNIVLDTTGCPEWQRIVGQYLADPKYQKVMTVVPRRR